MAEGGSVRSAEVRLGGGALIDVEVVRPEEPDAASGMCSKQTGAGADVTGAAALSARSWQS